MKQTYLDCGKIINTHGVRGGIRVESYCDSPKILANFKTVYLKQGETFEAHKVLSSFQNKGSVVLTLEGFPDIDSVLPLKGQLLYAHRDDIPLKKGAMLQCDMIGLPVILQDTTEVLGTLLRIDPSPASDLLVIKEGDHEVLLPNIPVFVSKICEEGIYVTPPAGLFQKS